MPINTDDYCIGSPFSRTAVNLANFIALEQVLRSQYKFSTELFLRRSPGKIGIILQAETVNCEWSMVNAYGQMFKIAKAFGLKQ